MIAVLDWKKGRHAGSSLRTLQQRVGDVVWQEFEMQSEHCKATFDICLGLLLALQNSSQFSQSLRSPLNFLVARSYRM